jgi:hypothetical protein
MRYCGYDFECKEGRIEFDPEITSLKGIEEGQMMIARLENGQWILHPFGMVHNRPKGTVDFKLTSEVEAKKADESNSRKLEELIGRPYPRGH